MMADDETLTPSEPASDSSASSDNPVHLDKPVYFHLLSKRELGELRPVLERLRDARDPVLDHWYRLYCEHFGSARSLPEQSFREFYGRDLDAQVKNLLDDDMEGFEADVRALGFSLADGGVPFAEVVASQHLFEESAAAAFKADLKVMVRAPDIYLTFDKLSHCRMILLAGAYFAGHEATESARRKSLEREAAALAQGPRHRTSFHGLVGRSEAMRILYEQIAAAAGGYGAVFIVGETGVGKELVARALHEAAGRGNRPFLGVNCAALPKELIESELFGHRRGSYTGAHDEYLGLIRSANDGTLFLDEVTEMPLEAQAKLLRVLEERVVRPVGTTKEMPVRCRFVASTNRDPEQAVREGHLRRDLLHRLDVHRLEVPPLRERPDDVPALCQHFAEIIEGRNGRPVPPFTPEAIEALCSYAWPGNVRDLRNAVEHGLTFAREAVRPENLPSRVRNGQRANSVHVPTTNEKNIPTLRQAEMDLIRRALEATNGCRLQAAKLLGISRHRLYDRLRELKIEEETTASAQAGVSR